MIGFGIFLFIMGLCFVDDGGVFFIIIGTILFLVGIAQADSTQYTQQNNSGYDKKIDYIIKHLTAFSYILVDPFERKNVLNQLTIYKNLRIEYYNLNAEGRLMVDKTYEMLTKIIDDTRNDIVSKFHDYIKYQNGSVLPISGTKMADFYIEVEKSTDIEKLELYNKVLSILMLMNNNIELAIKGYNNLNISTQIPIKPEKIHIIAMQSLLLKLYMESPNAKEIQFIFNNLFASELMKADTKVGELKRIFRRNVRKLKDYIEEHEDEVVIAVLLILEPNFMSKYNPNKKYYAVLGLPSNATYNEVEQAYKKLLVTKHPDRGGSIEEWSKINEAYTKIKESRTEENNKEHLNSKETENKRSIDESPIQEDLSTTNKTPNETKQEQLDSPKIENTNDNLQDSKIQDYMNKEYQCPKCKSIIHYGDNHCNNCNSQIKWIEKNN